MENNPAPTSAPLIKDLRAALHRHESYIVPLARFVLFWDAFVCVVIDISRERKGRREGTIASAFLAWVDDERLICAAMICDASVQGIELIRFFDLGNMDPSAIPFALKSFVRKVHVLFVEGKCVELGYTSHMLRALERPLLLPGGRSVGGVDVRAALGRCLRRLQCWVSLALDVIQTEFPEQEVLQAFSVFALHAKCEPHALHSDRDGDLFDRHLKRLALVADVPVDVFANEFWVVQPVAQALYRDTPGLSHSDAWRDAFHRCGRKSWRGRLNHLQSCLTLYVAFHACTTSNTERLFSKQQWVIPPYRRSMHNRQEHNEMEIVWNFNEVGHLKRLRRILPRRRLAPLPALPRPLPPRSLGALQGRRISV